MRPVRFRYERPDDLTTVLECLRRHGEDGRLIAGGQSLLVAMHRRQVRPRVLIDLAAVPGLDHVQALGGGVRVGALVTHRTLEQDAATAHPRRVLGRIAAGIGDVAVRTRGTLGGTLALAAPIAEWCLVARLADAEVELVGPGGQRTMTARDYFDGARVGLPGGGPSAVGPGEVVTQATFPRLPGTVQVLKSAVRAGRHGVVAAAASADLADDGSLAEARLVVGGVGARIVRPGALERELVHTAPSGAAARVEAALRQLLAEIPDDRVDRDERIRVAAVLAARALAVAVTVARTSATTPATAAGPLVQAAGVGR
jgi:aerobic carbon-monoxide dehydrogenase medium subunit